jgi:Flp pilus assembly protein TadD
MKKVLILLLAIVILSVFVLAHDQIFLKTTVVADEAKEDPDFYISLGDFFIEDGHTEKAIGAYKQALKLDPKNENVLNNLAVILHRQEDFVSAINYLRTLVELHPEKATYNYDLAINIATNYWYTSEGSLNEAIAYFEEAEFLEPGYKQAVQNVDVLKEVLISS